VKRKSDSSDDTIVDEEEKNSEPQQKRAAPSPWIKARKEEVPPLAVKRKKSNQGECSNPVQRNLSYTFRCSTLPFVTTSIQYTYFPKAVFAVLHILLP
jgi:hypothetical protein